MGEWSGYVCGSVCVSLAVLLAVMQFIGGIWCFIEFRRKWRSVPELWTIDWLDIVHRVEREFRVMLSAADFEGWAVEARLGLTAGKLWELITAKHKQTGIEVTTNGWERLVVLLSEALNVKVSRINPNSRLYTDLGMGNSDP